jgi:hypothetical protein
MTGHRIFSSLLAARPFRAFPWIVRLRQAEPSNRVHIARPANLNVLPMEGPACQDRAWDEPFSTARTLLIQGYL